MRDEACKLLVDIQHALADIRDFITGCDLAAYRADAKCRAAVERKFEIIGEACVRLRETCPEIFHQFAAAPRIIGFRNRLIHGYDSVDDGIVWDVIVRKLPDFERKIASLLETGPE
ncbi:MAG: DUF86 domain-containing protein [Terrimicrobiaceae bacterium]|nr:DUF86 domain-containing protein [Terrimicrobiaceae bacterium]